MDTFQLDLESLKIDKSIELHGSQHPCPGDEIESGCIVFLFQENHKDRQMIGLNLLNACRLFDVGALHCAGVEEVEIDFYGQKPDSWIQNQSTGLFAEHRNDEAVVQFLRSRHGELRYGTFTFGKGLRLLRPNLLVRPVEDPHLHAECGRRQFEYLMRFKDEQFLNDPIQFQREEKWIENLFSMLSAINRPMPKCAVLNTGLSHTDRLASRLSANSIRTIVIEQQQFLKPIVFE